jgi:hypothetical protein
MAVTVNASTSSGLVWSSDLTGAIQLQTNGSTKLTVDSTGVYGHLISGTVQTTNSGTATFYDFTGIPSWVKRITVVLASVTPASSTMQIQLGTSAGIDATVSVGGSVNGSESGYAVDLRRSLSEVVSGLEIALGYGHSRGGNSSAYTTMSYELSYNINKQFSVAYGIVDPNGDNKNIHVASVRYNY